MKILLFPSDLGGGFGHISRCLAIAQEAQQRGHICSFVTNTRKYNQILSDSFQVYTLKTSRRWNYILSRLKAKFFQFTPRFSPIFIEVSGLDFQVVRDGLVNEAIIKEILVQYVQIVENFKPNLLIGESNLLVWMLSKMFDIPVVQIVRYASHPATGKFIWWKNEPEGIIPPNSSALFNPLLEQIGIRTIKRAEDLLQGDLYIVPSIPEIEPIPTDGKTFHVGELTVSRISNEIPSWFKEINNHQPLVYVTIGGGAKPVGNKLFFSTIAKVFANKNIQVIVSTSRKFNPQDFPDLPRNIRFFKWVPGKLLISRADFVIFHGGYGTMMETIACGKPAITIPFHSEQEGNGRRLEQAGCGIVVKLSKENYKRIEGKWKYGTFSFLIQNRYDLTPEELVGEVNKILFNAKYQKRAQIIQSRVKEYQGPKRAVELMEKCWR